MSDEVLLRAYDAQMREDPPTEFRQRIERSPTVVRMCGRYNVVLYGRTGTNGIARIVDEQVAHDAAALEVALAERDFEPDESETFMVYDLESRSDDAVCATAIEFRPVTNRTDVDAYVAVTARAFGNSPPTSADDLASRFLRDEPETIGYLVLCAGRAVGAGRLDVPTARIFASIWSGGIDPDYRHRGLYRALVLGRVRMARERGYRYLTVDARQTSRPILERLGFRALTTVTAWNWRPNAATRR